VLLSHTKVNDPWLLALKSVMRTAKKGLAVNVGLFFCIMVSVFDPEVTYIVLKMSKECSPSPRKVSQSAHLLLTEGKSYQE